MYEDICAQCPDKAFIEPGTESSGAPRHAGVGYDFDGSRAADAARRDAEHVAAPMPIGDARSQRKMLTTALKMIRAAMPSAATVDLSTSDQSRYGFVLSGVQDADGKDLLPSGWVENHPLNQVMEDVSTEINDLDWNGVVGEDYHGYARIELAAFFA
jgi:hypothetical protein